MTTSAGVRFLVLYDTPEDPEAFNRHYRDVHIPLVRDIPGVRRYTISRNAVAVRGEEPYYLVAELEWESHAALQGAFASPASLDRAIAHLCRHAAKAARACSAPSRVPTGVVPWSS